MSDAAPIVSTGKYEIPKHDNWVEVDSKYLINFDALITEARIDGMLDIPEMQDEIQKPNSEDYSDFNVCETCEVILIDESEPANACNCTVRNELRAEIRSAIKLKGGE